MKNSKRTVNRITAPVKNLGQRSANLLLILAAAGVLIIGRVDTITVEHIRVQVIDAVAPVIEVIGRPVESINSAVQKVEEIYLVFDTNQKLRDDRNKLLHWQSLARKLEAENRSLKRLLNFEGDLETRFITSRVIADPGGAFAHSLILNAGQNAGVRKGQAALTGDGLIGRISGVGRRSSRLLLITDLNSRIPVVVQSTRTRAVMAGTNTGRPKLIHIPTGAVVAVGDRIVTSGHGGVFPVGLPIGIVAAISDLGIEIQPYVNRDRIEYVRVLDYGLRGIIYSGSERQIE